MECHDEQTRDCPYSDNSCKGDTGLTAGFDGGEAVDVDADGDLDETESCDVEKEMGVESLRGERITSAFCRENRRKRTEHEEGTFWILSILSAVRVSA